MRKYVFLFILISLYFNAFNSVLAIEINCNQAATLNNSNCNVLSITRKEQKLNSYLKKNYLAYNYSIENASTSKVTIVNLNNLNFPLNAIYKIRESRIRYPLCYKYHKYTDIWSYMFDSPEIALAQEHPLIFITAPVSVPMVISWSFIASPYYAIMDKKNDKKALKDTENFLQSFSPYDLPPYGNFQFSVLLQSYWNNYNNLSISYRVNDSDTVYKIDK